MMIVSNNNNPLPDLVELKAELVEADGEPGVFRLKTTLRVHPFEYEEDDLGTCLVSIGKAYLDLEAFGLNVADESKFGQPTLGPKEHHVSKENENTSSIDKSASGELGLKSVSPSGKVAVNKRAQASEKQKSVVSGTETHYPMKSIGNNNWLLSGDGGKPLDGLFIGSDTLCKLTQIWGANHTGTALQVVVKAKDIAVTWPDKPKWMKLIPGNNQQRLLQILVAKSLHSSTGDGGYRGVLVLARSESSDEG